MITCPTCHLAFCICCVVPESEPDRIRAAQPVTVSAPVSVIGDAGDSVIGAQGPLSTCKRCGTWGAYQGRPTCDACAEAVATLTCRNPAHLTVCTCAEDDGRGEAGACAPAVEPSARDQFFAFLEANAAVVETWPEWMREAYRMERAEGVKPEPVTDPGPRLHGLPISPPPRAVQRHWPGRDAQAWARSVFGERAPP